MAEFANFKFYPCSALRQRIIEDNGRIKEDWGSVGDSLCDTTTERFLEFPTRCNRSISTCASS